MLGGSAYGVAGGSQSNGAGEMALTNEELRSAPLQITDGSGSLTVDGTVAISNLPATQTVAGTVAVSNLPATQPVSGSVSVSNLPATQAVTGTFWQATQPVSGPLTDVALRAAPVPVSGALTDAQLRATSLPVTASGAVAVSNFPATQPVSGAVAVSNLPATQAVTGVFFQATQPVSGTVAVNNFPSSQAVTGTFFQATQPVSIASMPSTPVTGTFFQATQPVSGPLTDAQLRAAVVPVSLSGTQTVNVNNFPGTQTVTGTVAVTLPVLTDKVTATNNVIGSVTLGNSQGKTLAMKTGQLVTTTVTADQVILTYTVTAGKTFYLQYFSVQCRLTTFAATATLFGDASLESPAATKLITRQFAGTGFADMNFLEFAEPIPVAAGTVIRVVCTPAAVTSFTWRANIGGFER